MEVNKQPTANSQQPTANSQQHIALLMNQVAKGGVTSVIKNTLIRLHQLGVQITLCTKKLDEEAISRAYLRDFNANVVILPEKLGDATTKLVDYINKESISLVICLDLWNIDYLANAIRDYTSAKIANWYHTMPFYTKQIDKTKARKSLLGCLKYYCLELPIRHKFGIRNALLEQYKHILAAYDYFIMLCPEYCKELISRLKLQDDKAKKVISLINTIELNPSPTLQKQKEIAYLGRYYEEKQVIDLLKVWQRIHHEIPDWTLKLYDTGPEEPALREYAERHQLPRLEFMGYTSDVQGVYDRAAISCLTSVYEGWPMAIIESQNNGVIPVSYHCSEGVVSVIGADERAGRLVPYGDIAAYGRTLVELAQSDELRRRLQAGCLEKRLDYAPDVNDSTWRALLGF